MRHIESHQYTEDQYRQIGMLDSWYTLLDAHNALRYGFIQNRLAEPGKAIEVKEAESHISHIEKEWEAEREMRDYAQQWTGAPPFSAMPLNAKLYLHSVLSQVRPPQVNNSLEMTSETRSPHRSKNIFWRRLILWWKKGNHNLSRM